MIFAIEGNFAYSFVLGVLAAVNPCGFVLLPTYLIFFLGTREEPNLTTGERLRRALIVSSRISLGFLGIFFVIGIISRLFTPMDRTECEICSARDRPGFISWRSTHAHRLDSQVCNTTDWRRRD